MRLKLPREKRRHPAPGPRLAIVFILGLMVVTGLAIMSPSSAFQPAKLPRTPVPGSQRPPASQAQLVESFGKRPLAFEVNQGQADSAVKFLSRGSGYTLFLNAGEAVLTLRAGNQRVKVKAQKAKVDRQPSAISGQLSASGNWKLGTGNSKSENRNLAAPTRLPTRYSRLSIPESRVPSRDSRLLSA